MAYKKPFKSVSQLNTFNFQTFNAAVDIHAETPIPTEMKKGGSALIKVEAYVTAPMADLTFTATQPLGYTVSTKFEKDFKFSISSFRTFFISVKLLIKSARRFHALKVRFGTEMAFHRIAERLTLNTN